MHRSRLLFLWLMAPLVAACGGSDAGNTVIPSVATTLVVEPGAATLEMGSSQTFHARVLDRSGQPVTTSVSWSSANSAVAEVDGQGMVTGVAPGLATVTARAQGVSGSSALTVRDSQKPTVTVTSPATGAEVSGAVPFSVGASDNHGVSGLSLRVDGGLVQTLTPNQKSGSYTLTWDATAAGPGSHAVAVEASDPSGNTATASLSVTVREATPPATVPCTIYPADNPWNTDISAYPVKQNSDAYIARLSSTWRLSFAASLPTNVIDRVKDGVPLVSITYTASGDPGPMPIPFNAVFQVKDSSRLVLEDNHLVVFDQADCRLYELWSIQGPNADSTWTAATGSVFDLTSNNLRPDNAPSSSASGLPVFVGIARADEAQAGAINHALAIPATLTFEGFIRPATALQSDNIYEKKIPLVCATPTFPFTSFCQQVAAGTFPLASPYNAPMGLRLRLKADYDLSGFTGDALMLLQTAKKYGLIVSDGSGTTGMLRGEQVQNPLAWNWSTSLNRALASVPATAFEVVETGPTLH